MTTSDRRRTRSGHASVNDAGQGSGMVAALAHPSDEDSREKLKIMRQRCEHLETENKRLKLLVAELMLRNQALKLAVAKDA